MSDTIIVLGNCQAANIASILSEMFDGIYQIKYLDPWLVSANNPDALQEELYASVVLAQNVYQWRPELLKKEKDTEATVIRFPSLMLTCLWPYDSSLAGEDIDMKLVTEIERTAGATSYSFGFHDYAMCELRKLGLTPERQVERYARWEVPNAKNIRRFYELDVVRLRNDDQQFQLTTGSFILENICGTRTFHGITHPTFDVLERLAQELASKLPLGSRALAPAKSRYDNMAEYQVPINPTVARTLGLAWIQEDTTYSQPNKTKETFREYFLRYARLVERMSLGRTV